MKKILLLLIVSSLFISCDTSECDCAAPSIIGNWTGIAIDFTGTAQVEVQGFPVTVNLTGEGYDLDFSYTLAENPNTATSEGNYSMEVTASILGQTQTMVRNCLMELSRLRMVRLHVCHVTMLTALWS